MRWFLFPVVLLAFACDAPEIDERPTDLVHDVLLEEPQCFHFEPADVDVSLDLVEPWTWIPEEHDAEALCEIHDCEADRILRLYAERV
jgi:hypothetical protein